MELNDNSTLAQWASNFAGAAPVFLKYDLDFCCGGAESLKNACQKKEISSKDLIDEIKTSSLNKEAPKWNSMNPGEIVDDILERFHKKHREDLQTLIPLAQKVESVHADKPDCPKGLANFLELLFSELESHMQKEEQILFPMIKSGQGMMAQAPIQVMMHEHIGHGENLEKLKTLAKEYILPENACRSWTALYQGVSNLEKDIKEHIATENNILFPKVLKEEKEENDGCCGSCS